MTAVNDVFADSNREKIELFMILNSCFIIPFLDGLNPARVPF